MRLEQQVEQLLQGQEEVLSKFREASRPNIPDSALTQIAEGQNPVKVIRQCRLLTQQQLAEISGVGVNYISRIENGGGFGLQTAQRLAEALRVKVEDLS